MRVLSASLSSSSGRALHPVPEGAMAIDILTPVVRQALAQADVKAGEIDLIVSLSLSPDHLAVAPDIIGPRIGHPLQRELNADRAYVFDLMDTSAAKALHVADVFAHQNGYRRVLFLRAECTRGLEADPHSGFTVPHGAMAMVCAPDGQSRFATHRLAGVPPMMLMLNEDIRDADEVKGLLRFDAPGDVQSRYLAAQDDCVASLETPRLDRVAEQWDWWPTRRPCEDACLGPFGLGAGFVERLARGGRGLVAAISFDPFGPAADVVTLHHGA